MTSRSEKVPLSFWLFAGGFFTCTWDTLFTVEAKGFTLKLHQLLFFLAFLATLWENRSRGLDAIVAPLSRPFACCFLALALFQIGLAPWSAFPLKSFLYACWLLFDLGAIWLVAQHLGRTVPSSWFPRLAWLTMLCLSAVVLVDQAAYQFGYVGGLIGRNQDALLHWGMSRPHAFANEPSYLAAFLSLGLITTAYAIFQGARRKALFWLTLAVIVFANVATTSRTGWFSLAAGLGIIPLLPVLKGRGVQWRPLAALLALGVAVAALFYVSTPAHQRDVMNRSLVTSIAQGKDGSGNSRLQAHILAYHMAADTHWLGTGMGASYRYLLEHGGVPGAEPGSFTQEKNGFEAIMSIWGQLLAEGGPLSVLLYALAGFLLSRDIYLRWKRDDNRFALGSLAAALVCFGFVAFWLGNVCRGDIWAWLAVWGIAAEDGPGA